MELNRIFLNAVSRPIEGVIKADDESSLYTELSEYVLTDEVAKRLEHFLDGYNDYHGANGVWVSGFFGSGKSHLLKMLALLLENRVVNGSSALEIFLPKISKDDELLRAALKRAVAIPSKSILFNIDQKADIISKTQIDALLSVFVKVFNEMCGYFGKQGYIAQFERDLDSRNQFEAFKETYKQIASKPWERGREQALLESGNIARAYAEITGDDPSMAKGILDKYRAQYSVSIEDFGNQVKAWLDQGIDMGEMAVNISAHQFRQPEFVQSVRGILAETGLPASRLELEITESTIMHGVDEAIATMKELRAMGLRLAIDDFGTGYSSLAYLRRFPLDRLKIDRAFLADIETDPDAASLLTSIVQLGRSLGLQLVAEGVENFAQAEFLRILECERVQGFHFYQPVSAEEVVGFGCLRQFSPLPA